MTPDEIQRIEALSIANQRGLLSGRQSAAVNELVRRKKDKGQDLSFTQKYHLETLRKNAARQNRDGSITTVYAVGIPYKGMIYNVPSYDNETGEIITDQRALLERWLPAIKSGEVRGYPERFDGDIRRHPANVAASSEHEWIDRSPGSSDDIGFNMRWKNRGLLNEVVVPRKQELRGQVSNSMPTGRGQMGRKQRYEREPWTLGKGLKVANLSTLGVPVVNDIAGFLDDSYMYLTDPESRTWGNAAMSAAGLLPFVPSASGIIAGRDSISGASAFSRNTGQADVDQRITEIVEMTPDEYLQGAFDVTDGALGGDYKSWLNSNRQPPEVAQQYADEMRSGSQFPLPYIDRAGGSQDGRNRALAAKIAGFESIPVGVIPELTKAQKKAEILADLDGATGIKKFRLESQLANLEEMPTE